MSNSISRLIGTSSLSRLQKPSSNSFSFNPNFQASLVKRKELSYRNHGFCSKNLHYDPMLRTMARRSFVVRSNVTPPPGVPLPSGPPSGSMRNWIVGIVLTFVLPFITHKWGPLLVLKNKVDNIVNTAEYIMETIEDLAEKADNVIDNITDDLPENSQLRKRMEAIDAVIEGVAKSAHVANDLIDKVEEVEDKLQSLILDEAKLDKVADLKQLAEKKEISTQQPETLKID